jgi:hypothetical protein
MVSHGDHVDFLVGPHLHHFHRGPDGVEHCDLHGDLLDVDSDMLSLLDSDSGSLGFCTGEHEHEVGDDTPKAAAAAVAGGGAAMAAAGGGAAIAAAGAAVVAAKA